MKSLVQFARKQFLGKGKTSHNGRGRYVMEFDPSQFDEISKRIYAYQQQHKKDVDFYVSFNKSTGVTNTIFTFNNVEGLFYKKLALTNDADSKAISVLFT